MAEAFCTNDPWTLGMKDRLHFWTSDMPLPEEPFTYPDQDLCWGVEGMKPLNDRDQP